MSQFNRFCLTLNFIPKHFFRFLCFNLGLLLTFSNPSYSHNGAIAYAYPVSGISIDGNLSDWPEGLNRYAIQVVEIGDPIDGNEDFEALF